MLKYTIRLIENNDEPFLWNMLYHALHVPEGEPLFPKDIVYSPGIAKYVDGWGKDSDKGYIAVEMETVQSLGAVWVRSFTAENKGYGYVGADIPELSMAILPSYRNRGMGTILLNYLIDYVRGQYRGLSLSVSFDNPALRLYQRFGFVPVAQDGSSITMVKMLY